MHGIDRFSFKSVVDFFRIRFFQSFFAKREKRTTARAQGKTEGKANRKSRGYLANNSLKKPVTLTTQDTELNSVSKSQVNGNGSSAQRA